MLLRLFKPSCVRLHAEMLGVPSSEKFVVPPGLALLICEGRAESGP